MGEQSPEQSKSQEMRAVWEESLDVLRIYRHDLMNQVQLIRAYTQLKKYERLEEPIHALIAEAQRHSEWSSFPSPVIAYVMLSRDIRYPMLQLHATYEQQEVPEGEAEWTASQILTDILDHLGEQSRQVFEPIPVDVWIVSYRTGYEIGWFLSGQTDKESLSWSEILAKWQTAGVTFDQEEAEDGIESVMRFERQSEETTGL